MATGVPIRPETLQWAIERAGISEHSLSKALNVKPEKILAWLEGADRPTYNQAKKLAERCRIAFSQLLVPPPKDQAEIPLKDFRRGPKRGSKPSLELIEAVYDALRKRDWWREYRRNEPLPFLHHWPSHQYDIQTIKEAILKVIPVQEIQHQAKSWNAFRKLLIEEIEAAGILVLCQSYVGANTHRVFNPEEFSGFAIADRVAPIIFLNSKDYLVRQIFTLMHELVHVWLGESVLDADLEDYTLDNSVLPTETLETFCDQVAAEILMPEKDFKAIWQGKPYEQAQKAASRFKVSVWAALKRAKELKLITYSEYKEAMEQAQETHQDMCSNNDGGNFWSTFEIRNSKRFARTVLESALNGDISAKEMASLLNLNLPTALTYMERAAYVSN